MIRYLICKAMGKSYQVSYGMGMVDAAIDIPIILIVILMIV